MTVRQNDIGLVCHANQHSEEMNMSGDIELIQQLLSRMESNDLDFKRDQYKLESNRQKSRFVKDIICMANTPRADSAFIVVGVSERNGRPEEVVGIQNHPDPVTFQNLVNGHTNRAVGFSYRVIRYLGVEIGLFEIPVDRDVPVMLRGDFEILKTGVVYTRRNAQNADADAHEIGRIIRWAEEINSGTTADETPVSSWESFYRACDAFDSSRLYIAVLGDERELESDNCQAFAQVTWQLLVDFDLETDEFGMYASAGPHLAERKSLRLTALDEPLSSVSPTTCIWVAANGLSSRPSTIETHTWREWNQSKARPLLRVMSELAQVTEPYPATAVIFGGDGEYVQTVCNLLDQAFGARLSFVFANELPGTYSNLITQFEGTAVSISLPEVCAGLRALETEAGEVQEILLTDHDGGVVMVPPDRARWIEEDLELVHINVGTSSTSPDSELQDFLKGMPISWYGLNLGVDVNRSMTARLQQRVFDELSSRTTRRINLWHWPGGGGSTVARRIAWNLHSQFPTFVAKRVVPGSLIERLQFVFSLTRMPILVLVEDSVSSSEDMDRIYDRTRSANVPVVFLQIQRREIAPAQDSGIYVGGMLDNAEAVAFAAKLAAEVPERRTKLESLIGLSDRRRRTPFYFGLVAFGEDFMGLEPYVARRLEEASEPVLAACRISSLLYHFGQQATPLQLLASSVGVPRDRLVTLSIVLPRRLQELFVKDSEHSFRPAHELIAGEILEQILSQGHGDKRNWRFGLADSTVELIDVAAVHYQHPGGATSILVRSVVIERRDHETPAGLLEGQFSDLIDRIPSSDGQRRVLERLTEKFPDDAHFWAHLGRFYTRIARDHEKAFHAHQKSLELDADDPVLFHMAGMALRGELDDLMDKFDQGSFGEEEESRMRSLVEEALRRFESARELDGRSEYSYTSAIQIIARVVGLSANLKGYGQDRTAFLVASGEGWYRELLDRAETLMSELALMKAGEVPSRFRIQSRASLDGVYGNFSQAIEGWTNLLSHPETFRPPVRRNIISAYISRKAGGWSELSAREYARISELAQQNMDEEPDSDQNLRIWFRAIRATGELSVERIAEQLTYKSIRHPTIDTLYYLYILKFIQSDMGIGQAAAEARRAVSECAAMAANFPHRTRSFEWLGQGSGIQTLVHESLLGDWDLNAEFWSNQRLLKQVTGAISNIRSPASGEIELPTGIKAFFVPVRGRVDGGYLPGRDIGRQVRFYLGFSYDGLRAWSVGEVNGNTHETR